MSRLARIRSWRPRVPHLSLNAKWVIVTVISFSLHAGWGALDYSFFRANAERREAIRTLACATATDAEGALRAIRARSGEAIPGDDLLALNKTRLLVAALEVNPHCPNR